MTGIRLLNFLFLLIVANLLWAPVSAWVHIEALPLNLVGLWVGFGAYLLSEDVRDFKAARVLGVRALVKAAVVAPVWPLVRRSILSNPS